MHDPLRPPTPGCIGPPEPWRHHRTWRSRWRRGATPAERWRPVPARATGSPSAVAASASGGARERGGPASGRRSCRQLHRRDRPVAAGGPPRGSRRSGCMRREARAVRAHRLADPGTVLTLDPRGTGARPHVVETVQAEYLPEGVTYRVTFRDGLYAPRQPRHCRDRSRRRPSTSRSPSGRAARRIATLSVDSAHPRYFVRLVNDDAAGLVTVSLVEPPPGGSPARTAPPADLASTQMTVRVTPGEPFHPGGQRLHRRPRGPEAVDDVNLVAVPGLARRPAVQQAIIAALRAAGRPLRRPRRAPGLSLYAPAPETASRSSARTLDSTRGYAALYYPWLRVRAGRARRIRSSCRPRATSAASSPARDSSAAFTRRRPTRSSRGALGVERTHERRRPGPAQPAGHQRHPRLPGGGAADRLGRAHDAPPSPTWQYVNIRRLFLFLEESIQEGIRWAVFEPNNLAALAEAQAHDQRVPRRASGATARSSAPRRRRRSTCDRRGAQPRSRAGARPAVHRDRRPPVVSGRVHRRAHRHLARAGREVSELRDVSEEVHTMATGQIKDPYGNFNFLRRDRRDRARRLPGGQRLRLDHRRDRAPRGRREHDGRASCPG